jgi:transglutaminase-like putative cysteine protease
MNRHIILIAIMLVRVFSATGSPVEDLIKKSGVAADFPNDNLLVIFDSTQVMVQESGLSYVNTHRLYKILTAKGALDLSMIKYGYDPLSAYADIKKVVIYRNNGNIEELGMNRVMDYPAPARAIYWGAREKMIGIGRLEPGDAVEVFLFRKGFTYALLTDLNDDEKYIPPMRGHFYDIVEFWSSDPVLTKVYQVDIPKDKPLQYEVYNGEVQSSVIFSGDRCLYSFTKKNIAASDHEQGMVSLSDVAPKLVLSTSPDWKAKSKWFHSVNEDYGSFESTPEIKTKVDELLANASNEMDSISILTHWVADEIRYSGISMGKGEGYTLHKGSMDFTDRCGVCKDKAGMLITMLRAAGFESYPAMTMAGSRIDDIPADQFNHCVTLVKLSDGKYKLLDPTWVPFIRELWSSAEQQQNYLMGIPEGANLAETPLSPPANHYFTITGTSEILDDGTLKGELTLNAEGQSDAAVRSMFTRSSPQDWKKLVTNELLAVAPMAEITDIDFGNPYDYLSNPIQIRLKYVIPGYALVTNKEIIFTPLMASNLFKRGMSHLYLNTDSENRKYPFRDRCSRLVELKETVKTPGGYQITYAPPAQHDDGTGASFEGSITQHDDGIVLHELVILKKRVYDAADWPSFRAAVMDQNRFAMEPVILIKK